MGENFRVAVWRRKVGRPAAAFGSIVQPRPPPASARPSPGGASRRCCLLFGACRVVPALVATGLPLAREARTQSEQLDRRVEQWGPTSRTISIASWN